MSVDAKVMKAEKKAKKSKNVVAEEVVAEVEAVVEKKSKKAKKAAAAEEEVAVVVEEPVVEKAEKKKKKRKAAVEEEETTVPEETEKETEEPAKKKSKKSKKEDAPEEEAAPKKEEEAEEKKEEVKEEKKEEEEENKSVIIFGLPYEATEETVKKDFEECGEIESFRMPINRDTGAHKGMAFIDFATMEGAKKALAYHETEYGGRTLNVRVCDKDPSKGNGKGKGKDGKGKGKKGKGKGPGEKPDGCTSLVVKFLNQSTTEETLWSVFEDVGPSRIKLLTDRDSGESKCVAFIDFEDGSKLEEGVKLNQKEVDGTNIFVGYNAPKGEGKGDGKKGDGKKGGKGKGKKGKGKKGDDPARAANQGKIAEFAGKATTFADSDSD